MNHSEHLTNNPPRELMTISECAAFLGLAVDTVYGYALTGALPGFKLGNRWRFRRSSVEKWIDDLEAEHRKAGKEN